MDDRVFFFYPGQWQVLRYLGAYEQVPLKLALGFAEPGELGYLVNDQEMAYAATLAPFAEVKLTREMVTDPAAFPSVWIVLNGFGRAADKRLQPARRILECLRAFDALTFPEVKAKADVTDESILMGLDDHGFIELSTAAQEQRRASGRHVTHTQGSARCTRPERRRELVARITTKGRRYSLFEDRAAA